MLCGEDKRGRTDIKACMQFDRDRDPTMSESNRSPRLSSRSLQVASTLSTRLIPLSQVALNVVCLSS